MNILIETLPTAIAVDGQECEINSDFRDCLRIILAFENNNLAAVEKQMILLSNLYKDQPKNIQVAIEQGLKFLNGGEVKEEEEKESKRLYSFEKDASFILAAFRQTHGIDIETEKIHWWKFMALFMDLGAETTFSSLISLRKRMNDGTATKEERIAVDALGDIFEIEELDTRTLEQRETEEVFMAAVGGKK